MENNIRNQIAQYCALLHEWNASYEEYAKSVGFSYTSLSILSAVYAKPGCTQKELAEQCFLPKQTVNAVITSFYKNGWIRLEELPEDRRNKTVNLTEAGAEKAAEIMSKVRDSEQQAMGRLTEAQQKELLDLTRIYVESCRDAMKNK